MNMSELECPIVLFKSGNHYGVCVCLYQLFILFSVNYPCGCQLWVLQNAKKSQFLLICIKFVVVYYDFFTVIHFVFLLQYFPLDIIITPLFTLSFLPHCINFKWGAFIVSFLSTFYLNRYWYIHSYLPFYLPFPLLPIFILLHSNFFFKSSFCFNI